MLLQQYPFKGEDEDELYDAILADDIFLPPNLPPDAADLPERRLRLNSDAAEVKVYTFFAGMEWEKLGRKEVVPLVVPGVKREGGIGKISSLDEVTTHSHNGTSS